MVMPSEVFSGAAATHRTDDLHGTLGHGNQIDLSAESAIHRSVRADAAFD